MSNILTIIYRIGTMIVAAQGLIVSDISAFNIPARWVSGGFGVVALIALLTEFVLTSNAKQATGIAIATATQPVPPPAPPKVTT